MRLLPELIEPCKTDKCLVRMTCGMRSNMPWERQYKCDLYKAYRKKWARRDKINNRIVECWGAIVAVIIIAIVIIIPCLGVWKAVELAKPFAVKLIMGIIS